MGNGFGYKKYRSKGEITKQVLLLLLAGALTTSPRTSQKIWGEIFRLLFPPKKIPRAFTPEMVRRNFHYLRSANLIAWEDLPDGRIKITLSQAGRKRALHYQMEDMTITAPRRWDGKWRLVIFDIPELKKKAREALRGRLRDLGFLQLQKSVWVHPFPCEDEITFLAHFFGVERHLFLVEAAMKDDAPLRSWFELP